MASAQQSQPGRVQTKTDISIFPPKTCQFIPANHATFYVGKDGVWAPLSTDQILTYLEWVRCERLFSHTKVKSPNGVDYTFIVTDEGYHFIQLDDGLFHQIKVEPTMVPEPRLSSEIKNQR